MVKHFLLVALLVTSAFLFAVPLAVGAPIYRGCFDSGPNLDGTANADFNGDVNTLTGALVGTGSWQAGNATKLNNGTLQQIQDCVTAAKAASQPGDEFVFFFSGHGGASVIADNADTDPNNFDGNIRIANSGGNPNRLSDDQLTTMLNGFKKGVTMSVVLDSCYSYTFSHDGNDIASVTQLDGATPVPAGTYIALLAAASPTTPCVGQGFTAKLANGIRTFEADLNKDGIITTQEAGIFANGYFISGQLKCDDGTSCSGATPPTGQDDVIGDPACGPSDVGTCPTVAIPEPASLALQSLGFVALGMVAWRRRHRK